MNETFNFDKFLSYIFKKLYILKFKKINKLISIKELNKFIFYKIFFYNFLNWLNLFKKNINLIFKLNSFNEKNKQLIDL